MARNAAQGRSRERDGARSSWLAALVGLVFLVIAGFGVGMVAGVVWEDPGLIFAYVTGETEEVAWDGLPDSAADVAARASEPEPPVDPQLRRIAAAESPAITPAAAPPPPVEPRQPVSPPVAAAPAGKVAVQVGAFESSEAAEGLAKLLESEGFPVYVSPGTKAGKARWRVRVGPLATREEAESVAARLKKSQKLPTWILNEDAS
jgi:cell division septation protein DedD